MVTVTRVNTTPDLRYSRIYISLFNCKNNAETVEGLNESEPFLRSRVASEINMRITPELVFKIDDSAEQGEKIDRIIDKIKKDDEEFRKTHPNMMQDETEPEEESEEE
jgi:ribosome-binding factor A